MAKVKTQELSVIEQPEFTEVVSKSKIELSKAQQHAVAFAPSMNQYHELAAVLSDLDKVSPTAEDSKKAREARLKMVKIRTGAETIKDDLKAIILVEGNLIQDLFNVVKNTCLLTEAEFTAVEKHQERIEAAKKEVLYTERVALLEPYGEINQFVDLRAMDEESFAKYLENEKLAFNTKIEQEKAAELARIKAEKKAESERLEAERKQAEENERIRLENEKLKAEQEKQAEANRMAKIEQDKKDQEAARLAKIESDKLAAIQAENIRIANELKAKQEAEQLSIEQDKARIEAEEAEKIAKEKAALLAPDKEKVKAYFAKFEALRLEFPDLQSDQGKAMKLRVDEAMALVKKIIIQDSKTLL